VRVLVALTYFSPHVSGLTIYTELLSRSLVERGHQVTVLTSQYDRRLPREELLEGVRVVRVPVAMRVSKGVLMPTLGLVATFEVRRHDVLSLHLPQLDAAGITLRGRLLGRPSVLTYHSDLRLPRGPVNWAANRVVAAANRTAAALADRIVGYTEDFAAHSPFLSRYMGKILVIPPPVAVAAVGEEAVGDFARRHLGGRGPVIGMAARLASEKGVEYVLQALPTIIARYPEVRLLFAGQHENVLGESEYARKLAPTLERFREHWKFLGVLDPPEMSAFFQVCDVTVLPSINSTETFGLVQIESMLCGTPVVASNLPGVRQPVLQTGMGKIVPIADATALAEAVLEILDQPSKFQADRESIAARYAPAATAEAYERAFTELLRGQ